MMSDVDIFQFNDVLFPAHNVQRSTSSFDLNEMDSKQCLSYQMKQSLFFSFSAVMQIILEK